MIKACLLSFLISFFWVYSLGLSKAIGQPVNLRDTDFRKADSIAEVYKGESLENLPLLTFKLTLPLASKVEKFRAIYTWISCNIESDHWAFVKNTRMRQQLHKDSVALIRWNQKFSSPVFKKLLKKKKTICTGYAYLLKEMASFVDIKCEIINGYGRSTSTNVHKASLPNHSWTAVKLGNRWYLCDTAWSSGHFSVTENRFIFNYNDGYFLADPALFAKSHYPLNTRWILMDKKPSFGDFLKAPFVYQYAFRHQLIPIAPKKITNKITKNDAIEFIFQAPKTTKINSFKMILDNGVYSRTVKPTVSKSQSGLVKLKYQFDRLGYYDVHIKYNQDYIVTYTVKVKRSKQ